MKSISILSLIAALLMVGCDSNDADTAPETPSGDIVQVAVDGGFSTLVAAVQAADLVSTLQSPGPFTVFAPTDAAFGKLPAGTVEELLKPENRDQLVAILTYHVVSGRVPASEVVSLSKASTVQGSDVDITVANGTVRVNNATVTQTDIEATNGIVHVIDTVLLPPSGDQGIVHQRSGQSGQPDRYSVSDMITVPVALDPTDVSREKLPPNVPSPALPK